MLDYLQLLGEDPIQVSNICKIKIPTVREVRKIGKQYYVYLNLLSMSLDKIVEILKIDKSKVDGLCLFDIIITMKDLREQYENMLSFFVVGELVYYEPKMCWFVFDEETKEPIGLINRDNYLKLSFAILEANHAKIPEENKKKTFRNKKAKEIYERMQAMKKKYKIKPKGLSVSIGNMVSYLSANSNSYNVFNIPDMTIYQLYDQFIRKTRCMQLDTLSVRWAFMGEKPFEFEKYYEDM